MTAVVALMEFAVVISLAIGRWRLRQGTNRVDLGNLLVDTLRGRGILLLSGGMLIGYTASDADLNRIAPFYEQLFRGFLMLLLLEMGMTATRQIREFVEVGRFMTGFAVVSPVAFGLAGLVGRPVAGWRLRAGRDLRQLVLYRRARSLPRGVAGGEPRHLPDRLARHHLPIQPAGQHAAALRRELLALWLKGRRPRRGTEFAPIARRDGPGRSHRAPVARSHAGR